MYNYSPKKHCVFAVFGIVWESGGGVVGNWGGFESYFSRKFRRKFGEFWKVFGRQHNLSETISKHIVNQTNLLKTIDQVRS